MNEKKILRFIGTLVGIGMILAGCLVPCFPGLDRKGMEYIGILSCMIFYLIINLCDEYIVVMFSLAVCLTLGLEQITGIYSAFSTSTVWLLIGVLPMSVVIAKSGLMKRVALHVLRRFPQNYFGQLLAFSFAGLIISPMIPSITAKASILAPFAVDAAEEMNLTKKSKEMTGLFMAVFLFGSISGHIFYSGSMNVFILLGLLPDEIQNSFTWGSWIQATWVWGLAIIVLGFAALWLLYGSKGDSRVPKGFVENKLSEMGKMSGLEKKVAIVLLITLIMWITKNYHGVSEAAIAITAVFVLVLMGGLDKKEFRSKVAWDMIIFIGGLVCMANIMSDLGVNTWLAGVMTPLIKPMLVNEYVFIAVLGVLVALSRYIIVSSISAVSLFYIVFAGAGESIGISPWITGLVIVTIAQAWSTRFNNTSYLTAVAVVGDDTIDYKLARRMSGCYVIISIVGFLLSIPLWKSIGLIQI